MRHRVVVLLLALTAGDYLLWNWSVTGGHDVLALASGLTLLPLGAVSLGLLALAVLGALARSLRGSSTMVRSVRTPRQTHAAGRPSGTTAREPASNAERLAA